MLRGSPVRLLFMVIVAFIRPPLCRKDLSFTVKMYLLMYFFSDTGLPISQMAEQLAARQNTSHVYRRFGAMLNS